MPGSVVREPHDGGGLPRRLGWLLYARLGIAVLGMAAIFLHQVNTAESPPRYLYAYGVLLFACSVNLIWLFLARLGTPAKRLVIVQIAVDVLCEALLVYFTGGVGSIFSYLFFATVLAGAMLVSNKFGILCASVSTICLSGINVAYSYVWYQTAQKLPVPLPLIPQAYRDELMVKYTFEFKAILGYLIIFALSLHVVAILAGWLVSELSRVRIFNKEILDHMVGGVLTVDARVRLVFANEQARTLLGLPAGATRPGRPAAELLSTEIHGPLLSMLEGQTAAIADLRIPRPHLPDAEVEVTTSLLTDDRRTTRGVIAMVRDVGLQHEMERARRRNERLQALSEMSAGMAHEIRNPLSSVRGAIQELQSLPNLSDTDRRLMAIILKESDRLNRIITDFLEYAREQTVTHGRCDLGELLREVALQLEKDERNPGARIVAEIPPHLVGRGEPSLLKQVFLNLGVNGIEASPPGGTLTIRARPAGRRPSTDGGAAVGVAERSGIEVEVIDQGAGIDPRDLSKIYDPFFTTKPQGTGMGLAIASRIVQSHDGTLIASSTPGGGTTFTVWLPA